MTLLIVSILFLGLFAGVSIWLLTRRKRVQVDNYSSFSETFGALDKADLESLWKNAKHETFSKGMKVFSQGDTVDRCYMILSGKINIIKDSDELGEGILLAEIGAGDIFGEFSYAGTTNDNRRMAHAKAQKTTKCISLSSEQMEQVIRQSAGPDQPSSVLAQLRSMAVGRSEENQTTLGWARVFRDPVYGAFKDPDYVPNSQNKL